MSEGIFITDQHSVSGRWAVFEDDGVSGWLYLTIPNEQNPIADCWIYNRIQAPDPAEIEKYQDGPPPASSEYAGHAALVRDITEFQVQFVWSIDGNAVALIVDGVPMGYVLADRRGEHSKNLRKSGPWGEVFNQVEFEILFKQK